MSTKKTIVAIAVAFMTMASMFTMQSCGDSQKMKDLESEKQALQEEYDALMANYNKFKAENEQYAAQVSEKDSIIAVQAEQIQKGLNKNAGNGGNRRLKKQISELRATCDSYYATIQQLTAENNELKAENQQAKEEVATANNNIQKLSDENDELNKKVKQASILVTSDVAATPEKLKCCGSSYKTTAKASGVQRIRIAGKVLANNVVAPGTITFYVRITKGSALVTNGENNTFNFEGTEMQYTASQDVEYYGQTRAFAINWKKAANTVLQAGAYTATVYANGHEIGKTNFSLK